MRQSSSYTTNVWTVKNDPKYAQIFQVENGGSAWYNAAALELRQRMAHGLSLQASYTWSHATGTSAGPLYMGVFPLSSIAGDNAQRQGHSAYRPAAAGSHQLDVAAHRDTQRFRLRALPGEWVALLRHRHLASGQPLTPTVLLTGNQSSLSR